MRPARNGRARRAVGLVFSFVALTGVLHFESSPARAEIGGRATPRDRIEPGSDSWRVARPPVWLRAAEGRAGTLGDPPILVYPPTETSRPAKLVMMLHGMCGHAENECPWFAGGPTSGAYLVCPQANLACSGGGTIWSGASKARMQLVTAARERAEQAFQGRLGPDSEATLIGFSLGAFVALDVAEHSKGEWKHLLLVGAFVKPNAEKLKAAGIESVLMASGDWDVSRAEMKRQARLLEKQGIHARYIGMGPVGHWFAKDMDTWLEEALSWFTKGHRKTESAGSTFSLYVAESTVR